MDVTDSDLHALAERLARGEVIELVRDGQVIGLVTPVGPTASSAGPSAGLPYGIWRDRIHLHEPADASLPIEVVRSMEAWPKGGAP